MNEEQILRYIYIKYGENVIFDKRKLKAHLLDMCLPKKSVNLLVDISRLQFFRQFVDKISADPMARDRLIFDAENEYALDRVAIRQGVDCWAYAVVGKTYESTEFLDNEEIDSSNIITSDNSKLIAAALREMMSR